VLNGSSGRLVEDCTDTQTHTYIYTQTRRDIEDGMVYRRTLYPVYCLVGLFRLVISWLIGWLAVVVVVEVVMVIIVLVAS